jgi:hypothetical protein
MQRLVAILILVVVCGLTVHAGQRQVRGQVINRDGAPQQCQINFFAGNSNNPEYRAASDNRGFFYLNQPRGGSYRVVVAQGGRQDSFSVSIDDYGLHPATLVVRW